MALSASFGPFLTRQLRPASCVSGLCDPKAMNFIRRARDIRLKESEKTSEVGLRVIKGNQSSFTKVPEDEGARIADISQRIRNILQDVGKSFQPDNLLRIDRAEMQACFLALEEIKILMSEMNLLRLFP
jgi:hypothetical protein